MKITVIATGFDGETTGARAASQAQTPVDLQNYTIRLKGRSDAAVVPERPAPSRFAISRRSGVELPTQVPAAIIAEAADEALALDPPSPFDVPAFLRRQSE